LGIYEMLRITNAMRELIRQKASEGALRRAAAAVGTTTLLEDGLAKVLNGLTSPEELLRVIELEAEETFPCPKCGAIVNRDFKSCPFCMFSLRVICDSCGQDLKPEWKMCPYCTTPVRAHATSPGAPASGAAAPKFLMPSAQEPADSQDNLPRVQAALPAVKQPKILVVDDDPGIAIEEHGADLVILDVMMPRMDGFAVCDALRKNIRTAFLPVMMLTASSDQANRTKGYLVGTDDYLSKPFEVGDFLARVTRLLRRTYGL
jgi:hypothetical protein